MNRNIGRPADRAGPRVTLPVCILLAIVVICAPVAAQTYPAQIYVDTNAGNGQISPLLFGHNIEWYRANNVMIDRNHPELGMRADIVNLARGLGATVMRHPGGRLAECYHWRNAVGPVGQRTPIDNSYGRFVICAFGTDEFMSFCQQIGAGAKLLTVNYRTGTPQEAANWVEYCNGLVPRSPNPSWTTSSYGGGDAAPPGYFAWLRAQFGHPEPYGVKYWQIGNEVQLILKESPDFTPTRYGMDVLEYSAAMKAVDPSIEIGACVTPPGSDWVDKLLTAGASGIDFMTLQRGNSLRSLVFETMYHSRTTTRYAYFPETNEYTLKITARGTSYNGVCAQMALAIDDNKVMEWPVCEAPAHYEYTYRLAAGYHKISLSFTNDIHDPVTNTGRDLFIYGVTMRSASMPELPVWYPEDAEQQLLFNDAKLIAEQFEQLREASRIYSGGRIRVFMTEGTMSYSGEGSVNPYNYPQEEVRHSLRLKSALWEAQLLNTLIREHIPVFMHWVMLDPGHFGLIREPNYTSAGLPLTSPTYQVNKMYSRLAGARLISTSTNSPVFTWPESIPVPPVFDGTDYQSSLPRPENVPYLDAIAAKSPDNRKLYLIVTNRHSLPAQTTVGIKQSFNPRGTVLVTTLSALEIQDRPDRIVGNVQAALEAHCETKALDGQQLIADKIDITQEVNKAARNFTYVFKPHSVTLMEFSTK